MAKGKKSVPKASLGAPETSNKAGSNPRSLATHIVPKTLTVSSYLSLVAVHTTLWAFTALYLPRASFLANLTRPEWDASQLTSQDRPQHPFLEPLTKNPTATLWATCAGAAALQGWWAGWLREWWINLGMVGTEEEQRLEKVAYDGQKLATLRRASLATLTASGAIHLLLILFGAPFSSLQTKTYLLALLLSIATVYPPAYVLGVPPISTDPGSVVRSWVWISPLSPRKPIERALIYPAIGTFLGCWVGVIPIALDWDRPWQAWPLTPAWGAIAGYIIASLAALLGTILAEVAQEARLAAA